jgi:hypothetical protein
MKALKTDVAQMLTGTKKTAKSKPKICINKQIPVQ